MGAGTGMVLKIAVWRAPEQHSEPLRLEQPGPFACCAAAARGVSVSGDLQADLSTLAKLGVVQGRREEGALSLRHRHQCLGAQNRYEQIDDIVTGSDGGSRLQGTAYAMSLLLWQELSGRPRR
jgi:hypothetical protein